MSRRSLVVLLLLFLCIQYKGFAQIHPKNIEGALFNNSTQSPQNSDLMPSPNSNAQDVIISDNAFLKGQFLEIGMAPCGCFGTNVNQPEGFHGNMGDPLSIEVGPLGFVADPDKDGWEAGSPAYNGDYFLPGSPEEGFGVELDGVNVGNFGQCEQNQIPMTSVSISYTNNIHYAVWEGQTTSGLNIKNTTFFNDTATYFMVLAQLVNTTEDTMTDVYYMRNVEPDNEVNWGGTHTTLNEVVYQANTNTCSKALVTATGLSHDMYLGLGAADSRARVTYGGFTNRSASGVFNAEGDLSHTGSYTQDEAISIAFQVGDLAPGDTANLLYSYILDEDQLNAAMSEMTRIMANGTDITTSLIYSECAGAPIDLEIVNGADFSWSWSPNLYLNANTGTQVLASPEVSTAYSAVGTNACATIMYDFNIEVTEDELAPVILNCPGDQFLYPSSGACGVFVSDGSLDPMATDNCYLASFQHNYNGGGSSLNGAIFPSGSTEILWIAIDGVGHRDSCSYTITVDGTDIQNPIAVCQDISLSLDDEGLIVLNGTEINNGSADNCGISSFSAQPTTFTCNDLGPQLVTLTVFDGMGNSGHCESIVTVVDAEDPVPVITNKVYYLDENGHLDFTVNDLDFGSWDNCGILNTAIDVNSYSCLDTNVNVVNFTVTDVNGNSANEIVYVTVLDTLKPIIQTGQILVELSNGSYTLTEEEIITDNCNYTTTFTGQTIFDCSDVGSVYSLGVSVMDVNGNATEGQLSVQVENGDPPVPTVGVLPDLVDECMISITNYPTATDVCLGTLLASTEDPLIYNLPGSYTIHWLYDDGNGNTSSQTQQVLIDDVSPPVPEIPELDTIRDECFVNLNVPTAFDNCLGAVSASTTTVFPLMSSSTVIWTYDDGHGNLSYQNQIVIIEDISAPIPDLTNLSPVYSECLVNLDIPSASDNCDGQLFATTQTEFPLTESEIVNWTYTDVSGNESYQSQVVIIQDVTFPVLNIETLDPIYSECALTPSYPSASDNCDGELTATSSSLFPLTSSELITWVYTDEAGNETTQTQDVFIDDVSAPTAAIETLEPIFAECFISPVAPIAIDNCDGELEGTTETIFPISETIVLTWTYMDGSGNSSSQNQYVQIEDLTAPIPNLTELEIINAECSADAPVPPLAFDNCDGELGGTTTTVFPVSESTTVSWTYTDVTGNVSTQTQEIVIEDVTPPVADLENLGNVYGECSVSLMAPTASDNCDGSIIGTTNTVFPVLESTTVSWTYTDLAGNVSTQIQEIVIEDVTVPVADLENLESVYDECSVSLMAPTASDNCDGSIVGTTNTVFPILASTTVSWTYTDLAGNASTQAQAVIIQDVTFPVPNIETLDPIFSECAISPNFPLATDNCDGDLTATSSSLFPLTSSELITWVYTDEAGHEITQTQDVFIDDVSAPIAAIENLDTIFAECLVNPVAPIAIDNCDGELEGTTVTAFPILETIVLTWTYTDGAGNSLSQAQAVIIEDVTAPLPLLNELQTINTECSADAPVAPIAMDNCDGEVIGSTETIFPLTESTIVLWTYTDGSGNSSSQTQEVVIEDVTAPQAVLNELQIINAQCSADAPDAPMAMDNCDGPIMGTTDTDFPITESMIVNWSFEDESGNISIQNQEFIIIDNISPVPDESSLELVNGLCSVTLSAPLATDHCDGQILGQTLTLFPIYVSTLISWEFIDNSGNSVIQTQEVIISDNMPPVAELEFLEPLYAQCSVTLIPPKANDNCGGIIYGTTESPSPIFNSETVVWTYMDEAGNVSVQNQEVIIIDDTAPMAVVENLDPILAECFISPDAPIAIDNCDGELEGTTEMTFPISETTLITWTYTDGSGNSSSQIQEVIIEDVTEPLPLLNELQAINAECSAAAPDAPFAMDNCDGEILGLSLTEFPVYESTFITWIYTDATGNTSTQQQEVLIEDVTVPIPDISHLPSITEECSANLESPRASDNCDGTIVGTSNIAFPITETTSVLWAFEDASGNIATQVQEVIIADQTPPVANLYELELLNAQCEVYEPEAPSATDACDGVILGSTISIFPITESTNITWTYMDGSGNSTVQIQEVIILDDIAPVADIEALDPIYEQCSVTLSAPSASDNCGGIIWGTTESVFPLFNSETVVWTYMDASGNFSVQNQEVTIIDDTAPMAVVENLAPILAECFISPGAALAIDNCDGEIEGTTETTFPISESTNITWTYTDASGNSSSQTQAVIIEDVTGPLPVLNELQALNAECSAVAPVAPLAIDNCDGEVSGLTLATFPIFESTIITWTYTDATGNISTQQQEVWIEDVSEPILDVSSLPSITEDCSANLESPTATDNCDGSIVGTSNNAFPITETTSVLWTFEDASGNVATQVQEVIIDDQTAPVVDLNDLELINEQCEVYEPETPSATDVCDGVIVGSTTTSFPITESTNIIWTYTDGSGNQSSQIQEVIIDDLTDPSIVCPDNFTVMADDESNTYTIHESHLDPVSYDDNCEVESISNNLTFTNTLNDAVFSWGYTSVVWTVHDASGRMTTCDFDVNIDEYVGLQDINKDFMIRVYPNPNNGEFSISIESAFNESLDITINNAIGQFVFKQTFNKDKSNFSQKLNLNHWLPGIYFLNIKSEHIQVLKKIVIE